MKSTTRARALGLMLAVAVGATLSAQREWRDYSGVPDSSRYVAAMQHLLGEFGFAWIGDTVHLRWYLRADAPAELASRVRDAIDAHGAIN